MRKSMALAIVVLAAGLFSGGCVPVGALAPTSARGSWEGVLAKRDVTTEDGRSVVAVVLRVETGPELTSPHVSPGVPVAGRDVFLVDRWFRLVTSDRLKVGERVKVTGQIKDRSEIYDSKGIRVISERVSILCLWPDHVEYRVGKGE